MVLMDRVVTVEGIATLHVTELDEDLDLLVGEDHDVLPRELDVAGLDRHTVATEDPEFLEVDVDRMLPTARVVLDDPPLEGVPLRGEAEPGAVHELAVDLPAPAAALEAERAGD